MRSVWFNMSGLDVFKINCIYSNTYEVHNIFYTCLLYNKINPSVLRYDTKHFHAFIIIKHGNYDDAVKRQISQKEKNHLNNWCNKTLIISVKKT